MPTSVAAARGRLSSAAAPGGNGRHPATSMFRRFGLRPDVLGPLVLATVVLPLGLILPVVHFSWALKKDTTFSVLTGTFDLLNSDHVLIGLIILLFSILFPVAKILALYALWFIPIPTAATSRPLRWLEFLGKWSMLDVFVVGILVGALDLGLLAETTPRVGAYIFTAAVLFSMAATRRQIRWARPPGTRAPIPPRPGPIVPTLALLALALLAAGLTLPLLTIDKWTFWSNEYSVLPGISDLFRNGYALMGVVLAIFVVVTPVVQVLSAAGLWIAGRSAGLRSRMATALRWAGRWAMADVFALGIAIVLSKIGGVVNVTPRPGLWLFLAGAVLGSVLCGRLTAPRAEPRATGAVPVSVA